MTTIDWLLKAEPWTEYRTRLDLLGESEESVAVRDARCRMISHPLVVQMMNKLKGWPGPVVSSHRSAGQFFHLLPFLADLGIWKSDGPMHEVAGQIFELASEEGPFGVMMSLPAASDGKTVEKPAWALCDAPRTVYALARMGYQDHAKIIRARDYLFSFSRSNGFPCTVSKELGKFRGPGRKQDPCPYATLIMLQVMSVYDDLKACQPAAQSVESLLDQWAHSTSRHPYMFFMGTDFRKLKTPLIWFDIMHVADTLSNFSGIHQDPRFREMIEVITSQAGPDGRYTPGSVWKAWSDWEFGQKKEPSPWLTLHALRILKRAGYYI